MVIAMKKTHTYTLPSAKEARKRFRGKTPYVDFAQRENLGNIGRGRTYLLSTYGCQGNEADSETIRGILEELGFESTDDERRADLILLNTCAVRESAENRVFGELGRLKQYKRTNPDLILGVAGCMPQDESVTDRILKRYPYVDLVFGTHNIHRLPELLEDAILNKERVIEVLSEEGRLVENLPKRRFHSAKAYVNIMFGCDEFCTYCIVPYTRGRERSRDPGYIIEEIRDLKEAGYQEVTLLGQNVNAYGRDFQTRKYSFADLLEDIAALKIPRLRFTTSHPNDFDDATIAAIARHENIMPHVHLPVQSGSDRILKRMNRKYTKESFLSLTTRLRRAVPSISLTTDIIVGFPGEREEDFQETLDLFEKAGFEGAFTFVFSPRRGTPAASYADETSKEEKKERLMRLNEYVNAAYLKGHERFEGEDVSVLVDGPSKQDEGMLSGYTPHHKLVHFPGDASLVGRIVTVRINEVRSFFMKGEHLEDT